MSPEVIREKYKMSMFRNKMGFEEANDIGMSPEERKKVLLAYLNDLDVEREGTFQPNLSKLTVLDAIWDAFMDSDDGMHLQHYVKKAGIL